MNGPSDTGFETTQKVYIDSLVRYIKNLTEELDHLNNELAKQKSFENHLESRKAEVTTELERAKLKVAEVSKAQDLSDLNMDGPVSTHNSEKISEIDEKTDAIKKDVEKLEDELEKATSMTDKMVIQKKIEFKEKEMARLRQKTIKLARRQRDIIIVKTKIERLKNRGFVKQQVKVATAEAKADSIQQKIDASANNDNIVSTLIEKTREARVKYYRSKAENAREVLEKMDNKSFIKGARAIAIARAKAEKLREKMHNANSKSDVNDMVYPPTAKEQPQAARTM